MREYAPITTTSVHRSDTLNYFSSNLYLDDQGASKGAILTHGLWPVEKVSRLRLCWSIIQAHIVLVTLIAPVHTHLFAVVL